MKGECGDCQRHRRPKVTLEGSSLWKNPDCVQSCIEAPGLLEGGSNFPSIFPGQKYRAHLTAAGRTLLGKEKILLTL